ncbi:SNF2-related protein [bacterium]|nr:SNF2-related protein [bacterium]
MLLILRGHASQWIGCLQCLSLPYLTSPHLTLGHVIKNDASQVSQALRKFHCAHCLLLTGTPLQNNLHELWALLNFLYPDTFHSSSAFDAAFDLARGAVDNDQLTAASALLRPFMLRRTKAEVEKGLPPKLETSIACPLSEQQRFWYKRLLLKDTSLLSQLEGEPPDAAAASGTASTDWKKLSSLLMQLRKCDGLRLGHLLRRARADLVLSDLLHHPRPPCAGVATTRSSSPASSPRPAPTLSRPCTRAAARIA